MRKNYRLFFVVASLLIVFLIVGLFIPVREKQEIKIEANFFNVLEQLNSPDNWKNWQVSLKDSDTMALSSIHIRVDSLSDRFFIESADHSFYVQKLSPVSFEIKEINNKDTLFYNIYVLSTIFPKHTTVVTTTRVNLLNYLFPRPGRTRAFSTATQLKYFMENPTAYYGYTFKIENTIDTVVVVKETIVAKRNWRKELSLVYKSLDSFIDRNRLKIMQPKIVSFKSISNDTIKIRAGIPVNHVVPGTNNIECLKMPKGHILVGQYKGAYYKRSSLSSAMKKYIQNNSLDIIAVPYEKFLNDSIPETDTSVVSIKMYYPILD